MSSEKDLNNQIRNHFEDSIKVKQELLKGSELGVLAQVVDACFSAVANGKKLIFCGNGGSAADAHHLATEMLIRLRGSVNRETIPAIALSLDPTSMTACGNDFNFEEYFERMLQALGQKGDVLFGISTSGKSKNVIRALKRARTMGIATIGFLGAGGGPAKPECDIAFVVPTNDTMRCQESHITAGHAVLTVLEDQLIARGIVKKL